METASSPLVITQLLVGEGSVDIEEVRDELRTELIMLNAELSDLHKKWDFWLFSVHCSIIKDLHWHKFRD